MQLAQRVEVVERENLVEPCFAIIEYKIHVYLAYIAVDRDTVHILGLEVSCLGLCETRTVSGIFRMLRLWRNTIKYRRGKGNNSF
jgi:hypothetical protein